MVRVLIYLHGLVWGCFPALPVKLMQAPMWAVIMTWTICATIIITVGIAQDELQQILDKKKL